MADRTQDIDSQGKVVQGEYNATPPTYADGDVVTPQYDENGNQKVAISSDVEIGAVELKNGTDDSRATINAANTARTTATTVLATQVVDAAGSVNAIKSSTSTATATIALDGNLSAEVDLGGYTLAAISMPAAWDAANLTFQAATATGGTFQNVYDSAGNELTVTAAASYVITDIPELAPLRFIKIRSGTSSSPVTQTAARTITLILKG